MPKLKVIDFLTGLFKAFKLIAIPNENGAIYLNTLNAYYQSGDILDVTKYTDVKNYDVERGVLLNQIKFAFQDPTTILNKQFKSNTLLGYGDSDVKLKDENGTLLDGNSLDVNLPFENILFERLNDINTGLSTSFQYGLSLNESLDPTNPKAVLFYNNNINITEGKLSYINNSNISEQINTSINTPSATLGLDNPLQGFIFNSEISTWNYAQIENTLYSNYWSNYITNMFNIKKRQFKFNLKIPIYLLNKIKLNTVLKIKDSYYRINDFTVNLLTGQSSFNLINSFDNNLGVFAPSSSVFYKDYSDQNFNVYVSNSDVMNITLQDLGFGTTWLTAVKNGTHIEVNILENNNIENRDVFINVNNGGTKNFQLYINQDNKNITFDNTDVLFNNTTITFND